MDADLMIEVPAEDDLVCKEEDAFDFLADDPLPGGTFEEHPQQPARDAGGQQQQQQQGDADAGAPAAAADEDAGAAPTSADAGEPAPMEEDGAAAGGSGEDAAGRASGSPPLDEAALAAEGAAGGAKSGSPGAGPASASAEEGPAEEEDELAASLLSNMAAWQSELDTFQSALRRCMESKSAPLGSGSPSVEEGQRGGARVSHSGPKGITGFRGVTQHKRTKRYEANVWMDHKQMYLGAFDAPEQAAHAHDIGALCSGKARAESLNFPMSDYETLVPLLHSLPHAQIVAALRGYGRLPTARPAGGISSGRLVGSPSVRPASAKSKGNSAAEDDDGDYEVKGPPPGPSQRPRRQRKVSSASPGGSRGLPPGPPLLPPMDWQAVLQKPAAPKQEGEEGKEAGGEEGAGQGAAGGAAANGGAADGLKQEPPSPKSLAAAQQAQLQALSAALMGGGPEGASTLSVLSGVAGGAGAAVSGSEGRPPLPPPRATFKKPSGLGSGLLTVGSSALPISAVPGSVAAFEACLKKLMAVSHTLVRGSEEIAGDNGAPRQVHSGPKGQSGYKGVTLYKRCQRYNAHIWLGKQTHIGTFHTAEQAAVAHDIMELWRNEAAQGLNFANDSYGDILPLLKALSEAEALAALRNYSRSPSSAAAAAASGAVVAPIPPPAPRTKGLKLTSAGSGRLSPPPSDSLPAPKPPAAKKPAAPPPPPPSLRRRHRKPQHGGSGMGSAADAEESSDGSVLAGGRQSAGSLMWYMLEQEKSIDESDEEEEFSDPDFSPAAEDLMVGADKKRARAGSESPPNEPLAFHPRSCPSVNRALSTEIPASQTILGARPPRAGSSHRWGVAVSLRGQAGWFGRVDRQRASVAADLSLLWRRSAMAADEEDKEKDKDRSTPFNVPSAGYEQDTVLMEQIRRIRTAPQLCQFMASVIPQDPPAPPGGAAAAAAAAAARPLAAPIAAPAPQAAPTGARKRKQQTLLEEARASKLQAAAGPSGASKLSTVPAGGAVAAVGRSRLAFSSSAAFSAPGVAAAARLNGGMQQGGQAEAAEDDGALAQAAAAIGGADTSDPESMLSALRQLVAAGQGGALLQEIVSGWASYPLMQQQDLFGALQQPVAAGDYDSLEGRLQVALDLASLF